LKRTRQELENMIGGYAGALRASLRDLAGTERVGFVLMIYDFGEQGSFAYAADSERAEIIELLEEALAKLRSVS
jgi:hypothetical protein